MSNVGGSAGDGGFQFQAKIIAFVAVHMLAEAALTGLEQDIEDIPIAVAAETNGPGDDIRIELTQPLHFIELQAKKGLRVDSCSLTEFIAKRGGYASERERGKDMCQ
jgi:hypothetical protein